MDIAYAPFVERFQPFLMDVKNYDITVGRPRLTAWFEVEHTVKSYLFLYAYYSYWENISWYGKCSCRCIEVIL